MALTILDGIDKYPVVPDVYLFGNGARIIDDKYCSDDEATTTDEEGSGSKKKAQAFQRCLSYRFRTVHANLVSAQPTPTPTSTPTPTPTPMKRTHRQMTRTARSAAIVRGASVAEDACLAISSRKR